MAQFRISTVSPDGKNPTIFYDNQTSSLTWPDGTPVIPSRPMQFGDAEVVSVNQPGRKGDIKTHVDSEEGDLTLQYFVRCPAGNADLAVNQFGNAAFVLVNPARPAGSFLFPNEPHHEYPLLPRDGLLVMYRSYTPHYQCPFQGDAPMVQVVCNIKLKRVSH